MAKEIQHQSATGATTLYAVILSPTGTVYNGTTLVALLSATWTDLDIPMAEQGTTGIYTADFPAMSAGRYGVLVYSRAGGSPAATDTLVASGDVDWDGTAVTVPVTDASIAAEVWDTAPTGMPVDDIADAVRVEMDASSTRLANLDASITSRAPASTALSAAVWTNVKAAFVDAAISGMATGGVSAGNIATAVWDAAPAGTPLAHLAEAVRDVNNASPAPNSLGAAVAAVKADAAAVKLKTDNLPASPAAVGSNMGTVTSVTGAVGSVTAPVTAGTVNDKIGYTLGANGLDALSMTLNSAPQTFREWFVWHTLRFRRTGKNKTTGAISVYGTDGVTVITTQATTDTTTEQSVGVTQ